MGREVNASCCSTRECDPSRPRWKSKGRGWATLNTWIWSISRMDIFLFSFRVFSEYFDKHFFPTQKSLLTSILTPTFSACFYEPPPHPSHKPTTPRSNGRPASFRWIWKQQTHCLLDVGHGSFHPCMRNKPCKGSCLEEASCEPILLWQSGTAQTWARWAEHLMLWTERGIQGVNWDFCHRIACREAVPDGARGSSRHTDDRACGRMEVVRSRSKTNKKNRERLESTSGKLKERNLENNSTVQQFNFSFQMQYIPLKCIFVSGKWHCWRQ